MDGKGLREKAGFSALNPGYCTGDVRWASGDIGEADNRGMVPLSVAGPCCCIRIEKALVVV